jgi:hypothetical protein
MIKIEDLRIGQKVWHNNRECEIVRLSRNSESPIRLFCHSIMIRYSVKLEEISIFPTKQKKEGWINIYSNESSGSVIHRTKEYAIAHICKSSIDCYITTIKIEWEE